VRNAMPTTFGLLRQQRDDATVVHCPPAIEFNLAVSSSPSDNSIARRHAAMTSTPLHLGSRRLYRNPKDPDESPEMTTFMESVV
jgi:hypothetical protein